MSVCLWGKFPAIGEAPSRFRKTYINLELRRPFPQTQPGVLPLMNVYDAHAAYTALWSETRHSTATLYLPIWHGDVRGFIGSRTTRSNGRDPVKNLFVGVLLPDLL